MTKSTLLPALAAAIICVSSPQVLALLSQLNLIQRILIGLVVYVIVSAHLQQRSVKQFEVPSRRQSASSNHVNAPSRKDGVSAALTNSSQQSTPRTKSTTAKPPAAAGKDSTLADTVSRIRAEQCPQLLDACYLDAAASPPYPAGLVQSVADELSTKLVSNPHSKSPSAISTADQIASIRLRVMRELFGIQDTHNWHLVFTSGTTASLKHVGEAFDWSVVAREAVGFRYLLESHTSAVGIRDLAARAGVASSAFTEHDDLSEVTKEGLVVLPLQCNATGRRYVDLMKRVSRAKGEKALLMVDAASYLSSSTRLDLSRFRQEETPDVVAFSFYKIFGYPTGLGGLLVKSSAAPFLSNKAYFGGGTVDSMLAESRWTKPRKEFEARFEDGTPNIHGILAVNKALDYYQQTFGQWDQRGYHVAELRRKLVRAMQSLTHGNGKPVVRLYPAQKVGDAESEFGPIVNFNVLTPTSAIVPPQEVDRLASISNIHLRMGRHCNPGFVTSQLCILPSQLQKEYAEGVGCDDAGADAGDLASASLRASLCLLNTEEDVERLVGFLARFFLSPTPDPVPAELSKSHRENRSKTSKKFMLDNITVYPIKSCAGQNLTAGEEWRLTRHGLEWDREWIVMNLANGKAFSQKRFPKMALIRPRIDPNSRKMIVAITGTSKTFSIDLDDESQYLATPTQLNSTEVCGAEIRPRAHTSEALRRMLTDLLGLSCTLARQASNVSRHSKLDSGSDKVPLIFSNESPFLLINSASVAQVQQWVQDDSSHLIPSGSSGIDEVASDSGYSSASQTHSLLRKDQDKSTPLMEFAASFRANFLISSPAEEVGAWAEDTMQRLVLGGKHVFGVLGECRRCQMVCVDQKTGQVKPQTLKTLAKYRRNERGRIIFGSHLAWLPDLSMELEAEEEEARVWVGMEVATS